MQTVKYLLVPIILIPIQLFAGRFTQTQLKGIDLFIQSHILNELSIYYPSFGIDYDYEDLALEATLTDSTSEELLTYALEFAPYYTDIDVFTKKWARFIQVAGDRFDSLKKYDNKLKIAELEFRIGNIDRAEKHYIQLMENYTSDKQRFITKLIEIKMKKRDYKGVSKLLDKLDVQNERQKKYILSIRAQISVYESDWRKAEFYLFQIIDDQWGYVDPEYYFYSAITYDALGDSIKAMNYLQEYFTNKDILLLEDEPFYSRMIYLLFTANRYEDLVTLLNNWVSEFPSDYERIKQLISVMDILNYPIYQIKEYADRYVDHAPTIDCDILSVYIRYYIENRELDNASYYSGIARSLCPESVFPYLYSAKIMLLQGNSSSAEDYFQDAIFFTGNEIKVLTGKARLYFEVDDYAECLNVTEKILELSESKRDALFLQAECYSRLGNIDKVIENYEKLVQIDNDNPTYLNNLAYILIVNGRDLETAERYIIKALEYNPDEASYIDTYAWLLFKKGEYETAEIEIKKAIVINDTEPELLDHLAEIYWARGKYNEAIEVWELILQFDPTLEYIKNKLNRKIDEK